MMIGWQVTIGDEMYVLQDAESTPSEAETTAGDLSDDEERHVSTCAPLSFSMYFFFFFQDTVRCNDNSWSYSLLPSLFTFAVLAEREPDEYLQPVPGGRAGNCARPDSCSPRANPLTLLPVDRCRLR
jgi:hypothetical protein